MKFSSSAWAIRIGILHGLTKEIEQQKQLKNVGNQINQACKDLKSDPFVTFHNNDALFHRPLSVIDFDSHQCWVKNSYYVAKDGKYCSECLSSQDKVTHNTPALTTAINRNPPLQPMAVPHWSLTTCPPLGQIKSPNSTISSSLLVQIPQ